MYVISTAIESKVAREFATMWKTAAQSERDLLCKAHGAEFTISIIGSRSTFVFNVDGSVKTVNPPRENAASVRRSSKVEIDWNRPMLGWSHNRPIYA